MLQNILVKMDDKIIWYFNKFQQTSSWTSKQMSEKSIKNPLTADKSFAQKKIGDYSITKVTFDGNCLGQDIISFILEIQ